MAHSASARKRIRQNASRKQLNRWRLRAMRVAIKDFHEQLLHGSNDEAGLSYRKVCSMIDKASFKGPIHKNQAARRKSRLNTRLKAKVLG